MQGIHAKWRSRQHIIQCHYAITYENYHIIHCLRTQPYHALMSCKKMQRRPPIHTNERRENIHIRTNPTKYFMAPIVLAYIIHLVTHDIRTISCSSKVHIRWNIWSSAYSSDSLDILCSTTTCISKVDPFQLDEIQIVKYGKIAITVITMTTNF